jgi:hypothetical protein
MKKKSIRALLGFALVVLAAAASAQDRNTLYLGASAGKAHYTNGCSFGPGPCKDRDTAGRFFAGLQFNRWLGIETGWGTFGHLTVGGTDIKASAVDLVGVLTVPVEGRFNAFLKGGAYHGDMKAPGVDVRKDGGTFGWGLQYNAGASAALRFEWQRYVRMGGDQFGETTHVDFLSVGLLIRIR